MQNCSLVNIALAMNNASRTVDYDELLKLCKPTVNTALLYMHLPLAPFILAPTTSPLRPELAILHGNGIILRDDFDSSPDVNMFIWYVYD